MRPISEEVMAVADIPELGDNDPPAAEREAAGEIRAEVERVVGSPEFTVPDRARKFLAYVVDETLSGRADRIKGYSIAIEVFGRNASFDAQSDPVVRIEAGRVRRALERYYLTAGRDDPIVITIPKGGYVPIFTWRNGRLAHDISIDGQVAAPVRPKPPSWIWLTLAALIVLVMAIPLANRAPRLANEVRSSTTNAVDRRSTAPDVPRLLVVPFADLSSTPDSAIIARGLTDEVVGQIAKFKEIVVIVPRSTGSSGEMASSDNTVPRYALEGSVRVDGEKLRLSARLMNQRDESVIWAHSYDETLRVRELINAQADIARKVATAVAQPYGIIFHADAARMIGTPPDDWEAYACTLAYYAYRADLQSRSHQSVEECLRRTTDRFPDYATAWALLSLTYLDEVRFRYAIDAGPSPPLGRALDAARRAVDLDPENIRGLQAYMTALFFQKDVDAALKVGARAAAINPNDTELIGEYGMRLALSGQWQRGREFILQVLDHNPGPLGYFESVLALSFYMQSDYASAATWIRKANLQANPLYHLIAAAIFGQLGQAKEAAAERDWLLHNAPTFLAELRETIKLRNMPPEDEAHFVNGLRKAGLSVAGF